MIALTKREILDELMKLGITSAADIKVYCKEYTFYFNNQYFQIVVSHQ